MKNWKFWKMKIKNKKIKESRREPSPANNNGCSRKCMNYSDWKSEQSLFCGNNLKRFTRALLYEHKRRKNLGRSRKIDLQKNYFNNVLETFTIRDQISEIKLFLKQDRFHTKICGSVFNIRSKIFFNRKLRSYIACFLRDNSKNNFS